MKEIFLAFAIFDSGMFLFFYKIRFETVGIADTLLSVLPFAELIASIAAIIILGLNSLTIISTLLCLLYLALLLDLFNYDPPGVIYLDIAIKLCMWLIYLNIK